MVGWINPGSEFITVGIVQIQGSQKVQKIVHVIEIFGHGILDG